MKKRLSPSVSMYIKPVYEKKHPVMALTILKKKNKLLGITREIINRVGNPGIEGFVDKSKLFIVESKDGLKWEKKKELKIKNIDTIIKNLNKENHGGMEFIGLEDPDIWVDERNTIHLYFTIAYKLLRQIGFGIALGHAQGKSLDSLKATNAVLSPKRKHGFLTAGFKEVSISPVTHNDGRMCLTESGFGYGETTLESVFIKHMGKDWKHLGTVADPLDMKHEWIKGDLSPGPILNPSLIKHEKYLVGFVNGRPPFKIIKGEKVYGKFRVGLMLFDPKTGKVPWISPKPLIEDPKAKSITFASDFLEQDEEKGILYAHVDDSFIRAYEINFKNLKKLLPKKSNLPRLF